MQTIQYSDFTKRYDVNFRAKPNDEDFVGAGGFGYVYKGYDKLKHTPVAIKRSATDKNLLDEFEKAKQLPQHVNIARYLEGFRIETEADDFDVAILQYYPKGNLNQLIASGKLNNDQIRDLVSGILEGISFLHKGFTDSNGKHRSIIHRDLKPQNILIAEYKGTYTPLITDFGISKLVKSEDIHSTGGIELSNQMGTMMYKAPEQVLGGTVRSNLDLWAFGIILFKMLTGKLPFDADSQMSTESVLNKITKSDLEEIFIQLKNYPEVYQKIIRKCLVRDIKTRIQTADELIEMLKGSANVIEEKSETSTNNQIFEEKTDDRNDLKNRISKTSNISKEELAKWNHPNALSILRVGSIHRGHVKKITQDAEILLEFGVRGLILNFDEITLPFSIKESDFVEVEILANDFEHHSIEFRLIRNLSNLNTPKPIEEKSNLFETTGRDLVSNDSLSDRNMRAGAIVVVTLVIFIFLFSVWQGNNNYKSEEATMDSTAVSVVDTAYIFGVQNSVNYAIPDPDVTLDTTDILVRVMLSNIKFSENPKYPAYVPAICDKIYFENNLPTLKQKDSEDQLNILIAFMVVYPKLRIQLYKMVYVDDLNNHAKKELWIKRLESVKSNLVKNGIEESRILIKVNEEKVEGGSEDNSIMVTL